MSIVSLSSGDPTCTIDDLNAICAANNFTIEPGSHNERAYLLFANSFDSLCKTVEGLPEYEDPRLEPVPVLGGKRRYHRPCGTENPLNGWSYKTNMEAAQPKSARLAGRTIVFKDNISVAGLPLGVGTSTKHFDHGKHPISTIDATVVKRVLESGGTVRGTATCENFSAFSLSYTSDSGVVENAHLPGYATGGSSSGCATLISIGDVKKAREAGKDARDYPLGDEVDMAVGGDQGGSIRLPAAYSGIYGLKPTYGLVPFTGIAPLSPMIDHTGPMARSVDDTALLLGVLAGWDGFDPRMTPESPMPSQVPDYLSNLKAWVSLKESRGEWNNTAAGKGLRIGILKEAFDVAGLDSSVREIVKSAAERFKTLGADLKEISIPMHELGPALQTVASRPSMPRCIVNKTIDLLSYTMPSLDPLPVDQNFFDVVANRNPNVVNVIMNATHLERKYGSSLARKAHVHVYELRAAYDKALEDVDVLLTPVNPTVGPPHPKGSLRTEHNPSGLTEQIMELLEPAIGNTLNTSPFNVTGHPALSMPIGWSKVAGGEGRLPVGMQVIGRRWDEDSIFKAAKAWEMGGDWMDN